MAAPGLRDLLERAGKAPHGSTSSPASQQTQTVPGNWGTMTVDLTTPPPQIPGTGDCAENPIDLTDDAFPRELDPPGGATKVQKPNLEDGQGTYFNKPRLLPRNFLLTTLQELQSPV